MSRRKLQLALYYFYDHTTLEKHFEKMAEKGWELDGMGSFWHYRETRPRKIHYGITYFPGVGAYTPLSGSEATFEEFCMEAGWELAAELRTMKIFKNERENPEPLESQADIQVENLHRACRKDQIFTLAAGVVGWLTVLWFLISLYFNGAGVLSDAKGILVAVLMLSVGIYTADDLITYRRWYHRAKANAERDLSFTPTWSHRPVQILTGAVVPFGAFLFHVLSAGSFGLYWILVFTGCFLAYFIQDRIRSYLRRRGRAAGMNLGVNFLMAFLIFLFVYGIYGAVQMKGNDTAVYAEDGFHWERYLPLALEQLTDKVYRDGYMKPYHTQSSLLLAQLSAEHFQSDEFSGETGEEGDYLQYVLTKVKAAALYDFTWNAMRRTYKGEEAWEKETDWEGAGTEVQCVCETWAERDGKKIYRYLIGMEDRVLKIDLSFQPDAEQKKVILEKLGDI